MNPELKSLAAHCYNGASNVKALISSLAACTADMDQSQIRNSVEVKMVVGQISYLLGESLGPTSETMNAWAVMNTE